MINQKNDDVIVIKEKKKGGCGSFLGAFIIGALTVVLCIVGAGAYLFFNVNLKTIGNTFGVEIPFLRGEYETMPLRSLLKEVFTKTDEIKDYTLADLSEEKKLIELPNEIPGTNINLTDVYDTEITFNGRTDKVKNFAVYNEIYKDFDGFVDKIIEVVYKTNSVDNLLKTLDIDIDNDLNYPAFTTLVYDVGEGVYKSFRGMTISEALEVLPNYFSRDDMTMKMLIDSIGLDVSDYKFAQSENFLQQKITSISDYIYNLPLDEFVDVNEDFESCENLTDKVMFLLQKMTYKDLSEGELEDNIELRLTEINQQNVTLGELMDLDEDSEEALKLVGAIKFVDLLKGNVEDEIVHALTKKVDEGGVEHDVTLGEVFNLSDSDSISRMIRNVLMSDLIGESAQPDVAIRNALIQEGNTLGSLLNYTSENGIMGMLKDVTLNSLLGEGANPEQAIKNGLCANNNTLGRLLNISNSSTGITKLMSKILLSDLLGESANISETIKNALSYDENNNPVTLQTIFEISIDSNSSGVVKKMASLEMRDLLGRNGRTTAQTMEDFVDELTLFDIFDANTIENNKILNSLSMYDDDNDDTTDMVATPIKAIPDVVNSLTLSDVCEIDEDNKIMVKLKDKTLEKIPNEIDNLTLEDALGEVPEKSIFNLIENYSTVKIKNLTKNYDENDPVDERGLKTVDFTIKNLYNAGIISESAYENFVAGHSERENWTIAYLLSNYPG